MGEGEGKKDVSDELEHEEQISGLQGDEQKVSSKQRNEMNGFWGLRGRGKWTG